ncbi:MAG: Hsp20/alpha crystallin family protein [Pyrinomonadaceae bacterium]
MAKSVEQYFRLLHKPPRAARMSGRAWSPAADVYQTNDGWIVKVELAGVNLEDLEFSLGGNTLVISGCRRDTFFGEGVTYHQLEIMYSRFVKTLHFPCSIDGATFVRDYRDGLLVLHLRAGGDCVDDEGYEAESPDDE